jgi:predicted PurR-regulated permease PerM
MDFIITLITFTILLVVIFCLSLFFYRIQNQITTILERQHNDLISQLDNLKNIEQQGLTILQGIDLKLTGIEKLLYVINHNMGLKTTDFNVLILLSTTLIIILVIAVLVNTSSTSNEQIINNLMQNNLDNILNVLESYNEEIAKILWPVSQATTREATIEFVENIVKTFVENDEVLTKFSTNVVTTLVKNDELLSKFVENTISTIVKNDELLTIVQGTFPNF